MKNVRKHIENLVSNVLKETIENKADQILESAKDMTEKLHGGQKKLDVAVPKGKLTKKKVSLTEEISNKCKYCNNIHCYTHKFEKDHSCDKIKEEPINLIKIDFEKINKI
jgi:predicted nucleic acid binding AN1-type Zn finger protein